MHDHKRINLLLLLLLHEEAPDTGNINSLTEVAYATVNFEFLLQNWVHIGCEVCPNHMKLQIDGEIVGEKPLSSNKEPSSNDLRKIVLANIGGDGNISHGYVYNFQVFPSISSIKDHHMKDPPLKLSIDESSASEIEEESDGVWSIVGGKWDLQGACRLYLSSEGHIDLNGMSPVCCCNQQWDLQGACRLYLSSEGHINHCIVLMILEKLWHRPFT
ncbi:uncharacterized protein LOC110265376 [Arachis ipaensis]|uniref:uncharacterized protein LOC110265376 n=1 Tax=Arachis ipaensis TaxID=130454 RepID=UPI000A2B140F|nr:uncharacterized protein LOC110265376 [Arachis ipaensis]